MEQPMKVTETFLEKSGELRRRGPKVDDSSAALLTVAEAILRVGYQLATETSTYTETSAYALTPSLADAIIEMDDIAFENCQHIQAGTMAHLEWDALVESAEALTGRRTLTSENALVTQALADVVGEAEKAKKEAEKEAEKEADRRAIRAIMNEMGLNTTCEGSK